MLKGEKGRKNPGIQGVVVIDCNRIFGHLTESRLQGGKSSFRSSNEAGEEYGILVSRDFHSNIRDQLVKQLQKRVKNSKNKNFSKNQQNQ